MTTQNSRADWLEGQSRLHFQKLASLSARAVNAQIMGSVAARADVVPTDIEKVAIGGFIRRAFSKALGAGSKTVRQAPKMGRGYRPVPQTRNVTPARPLAKTQPARPLAQTAVATPPQTMRQTAGAVPSNVTMSGATAGATPSNMTMSGATGRAGPAAKKPKVDNALRMRQEALESAKRAQQAAAPTNPNSIVSVGAKPQAPAVAPASNVPLGPNIIQPGAAAPPSQMLTDTANLRAAGLSPERATEIARRSNQKLSQTSKGHGGVKMTTALEGYDPRGFPLYRPSVHLSADPLNAVLIDIIERSMPSAALTKTAGEVALIDDEGIVKTASPINYWHSPQGAIHLDFLGGVYDINEDLAWHMAKNAGLQKAAITKLIAGAANLAGRGARAAGRARKTVGQWARGQGKFTGVAGKEGFNPFQRGAQRAWQAGQRAKAAPGRWARGASQRATTAGRGFADRVRQSFTAGTQGRSAAQGPRRGFRGSRGRPPAAPAGGGAPGGGVGPYRSGGPAPSGPAPTPGAAGGRVPEAPLDMAALAGTHPAARGAGGVPKAPAGGTDMAALAGTHPAARAAAPPPAAAGTRVPKAPPDPNLPNAGGSWQQPKVPQAPAAAQDPLFALAQSGPRTPPKVGKGPVRTPDPNESWTLDLSRARDVAQGHQVVPGGRIPAPPPTTAAGQRARAAASAPPTGGAAAQPPPAAAGTGAVPQAPTPAAGSGAVPQAPSAAGVAGTATDVAGAVGGGGGGQQQQSGLIRRGLEGIGQEAKNWSQRARTMGSLAGTATMVGVPLLGYGALSTAGKFLERSPNPHQYGMAAPQHWQQSHQM